MRRETARATTFCLDLGEPSVHHAGQHYKVRLTGSDGDNASRSYSVTSPPDGYTTIELTVERITDGEVSGFVHDVVGAGESSMCPAGRLTADDLAPVLLPGATAYVCGSTGFVAHAHARALLIGRDQPAEQIRVERFGPSAP